MKDRQLKIKITKILKNKGFVKSETYVEWNHPKFKHAGFEYCDALNNSYLAYFIPEGIFIEQERINRTKGKIQEMFEVLQKTDINKYIEKKDFAIIFKNLEKQ